MRIDSNGAQEFHSYGIFIKARRFTPRIHMHSGIIPGWILGAHRCWTLSFSPPVSAFSP
jgi:hypothetical protein